MTVQPAWAIQGDSHPSAIATEALAALLGAPSAAHTAGVSVTSAGGSHGVVGSGDLAVTQNGTPNMSVNVAAGSVFIRSGGSSSLLVGAYTWLNDATVNLVISASDPTNPRIDLVVAQVRDANYGEAASDERLTVVTGTPAASPAVPSLTSYPNCVVLAQVAVAAAVTTIVTANITDKRTRAYALGGTAIGPTANIPTGASLHKGLEWFDETTLTLYRYDGTGWIIMYEPERTYTPTLVQSGAVPKNLTRVGYQREAGRWKATIHLTVSGAGGTGGFPFLVGLPAGITLLTAGTYNAIGAGFLLDSGTAGYNGTVVNPSNSTLALIGRSTVYLGQGDFTAALANNDVVSMQVDAPMTSPYM